MLSLSDKKQLILLKLLTPSPDISMTHLILINLILKKMVGQIYTKLQLNKVNFSDTEVLILNLSITNGIVSSKIYDRRDGFNLKIVNVPFLDGDVPRSPSYGVYISQLSRLQECVLMLMTSTTETYFNC